MKLKLHNLASKKIPALFLRRRMSATLRLEQSFFPELLEIELTPPNFFGRILLWILFLFCFISIAWAWLGHVYVVTTAPGKIVPNGKLQYIKASDSGIIQKILVREGQVVKQNQIVLELNPSLSQNDVDGLSRHEKMLEAEKIRLEAEFKDTTPNYGALNIPTDIIAVQNAIFSARQAGLESRFAEIRNSIRAKELNLMVARDGVSKLTASLELAKEKEERMAPYAGKVIPMFDYLKLKDDVEQLEVNINSQKHALQIAAEEKEIAVEEGRKIAQDRKTQILAELDDCNAKLLSVTIDMNKAKDLLERKRLYSPVSGVVQKIMVSSLGESVMTGQTLATVVPNGRPSTVEAYVENEDVGFISKGQISEIKIDAFPFQHYGSLKGRVIGISPDSENLDVGRNQAMEENSDDTLVPTKAGLKYKVYIQIIGLNKGSSSEVLRYQSGMSVQVDIKTDRRRIIDYIIDPIYRKLEKTRAGYI